MDFQLLNFGGETILPVVLYGKNRPDSINEYHRKIMDFFGIVANYVEIPFPAVSHGAAVNWIISNTIDSIKPDYFWLMDHDSIPLKKDCINFMFDSIKYKNGIFSQATQSNHVKGPGGFYSHPYASQAFLAFSRELYEKLHRPSMDHWSEILTYKAEENGFSVTLMHPSSSVIKNSNLGHGQFGMGNIYGPNLSGHAMQQDNPDSEKWFVSLCQDVLDGKFENS